MEIKHKPLLQVKIFQCYNFCFKERKLDDQIYKAVAQILSQFNKIIKVHYSIYYEVCKFIISKGDRQELIDEAIQIMNNFLQMPN